jgi:hypothetical protein
VKKWERAAQEFIAPWQKRRDVRGALVCGSYVTGRPSPRSDIDINIVLAPGTRWRERGNRIVDGFLIEYFANTAKQTRAYLRQDRPDYRRVTATMYVTGRIWFDRDGSLAKLVAEAKKWHRKPFPPEPKSLRESRLYFLWDAVDNLHDAAERGSPDVAFQYYHAVQQIYATYARLLRQPVIQVHTLYGAYRRGGSRAKYRLDAFPDADFERMLLRAIREADPKRMPKRAERLAQYVIEQAGGFEIDGWKLRTPSV